MDGIYYSPVNQPQVNSVNPTPANLDTSNLGNDLESSSLPVIPVPLVEKPVISPQVSSVGLDSLNAGNLIVTDDNQSLPDFKGGDENSAVSSANGLSEKPLIENAVNEDRVSYEDAHIQEIDINKIIPNPFQPRKIFEPRALQELADSIKEHGVIQPLVVTETPGGFELVVGERRFRASQLAGVAKVPAIVKRQMQDQTKLEVALIENIQRQELNPIEEAQAYDRLMKTFNLTQEQVAKKVGKSRPAVANTVRLLNLPAEIQRGVIEGKISEGHARALLGLPDMERQLQMYKLILEQGMNVRQVEQKVRELSLRRQLDSVNMDPKFIAMESELRQKLSAQVKISRSGKGGKITIEFFSEDELKEIMSRMSKTTQDHSLEGYITV